MVSFCIGVDLVINACGSTWAAHIRIHFLLHCGHLHIRHHLLIYPSMREGHDQAMADFVHYGYGLLGSGVALAIMIFALIRILKGKCGSWTQGLLVLEQLSS